MAERRQRRTHLVRKGRVGAVCGVRQPRKSTSHPERVTCAACRACTLHMAAAEAEVE